MSVPHVGLASLHTLAKLLEEVVVTAPIGFLKAGDTRPSHGAMLSFSKQRDSTQSRPIRTRQKARQLPGLI